MNLETQSQPSLSIPFHSGQKKVFFDSQAKKKVIAKGRRWGLTRGYAHRAIKYLIDGISPGLWVDTVNSNIELFLKDKNKKMEFNLENAKQDFQRFWEFIGAEGNIDAALLEFDVTYNASIPTEGM